MLNNNVFRIIRHCVLGGCGPGGSELPYILSPQHMGMNFVLAADYLYSWFFGYMPSSVLLIDVNLLCKQYQRAFVDFQIQMDIYVLLKFAVSSEFFLTILLESMVRESELRCFFFGKRLVRAEKGRPATLLRCVCILSGSGSCLYWPPTRSKFI